MNNEVCIKINEIDKVKTFVEDAEKFISNIDVIKGHYIVDGKSLMGILSIGLSNGVIAKINSDDEAEINKFTEIMSKYA